MARHDQLHDPATGPDSLISTTEQPSRGQYATIATLACELLGEPLKSRADATVVIARLHLALKTGEIPDELRTDPVVPF